MNWKFTLQLSMLGLIMALGTVSLIPEDAERYFWGVIIIICAYMIAKVCVSKYFLHGFILSLLNSAYITIAHLIFFNSYITHHPKAAFLTSYFPGNAVGVTLFMGVCSGLIFGLLQGLFAFIASKFIEPNAPQQADQ